MNWKRILFITVASITTLTLGFVVYITLFAQSKIQSEDITQYLTSPTPNPSISDKPVDILDANEGESLIYVLIGSDSRDGANAQIAKDKVDGARSDTTMIVHVAHDRSFVDVISIPRDSIVDIPECMMSDGSIKPALNNAMFNSSFAQGDTDATSVACTVSTIQYNTGIEVDGYMLIDLAGFTSVVDAIGGVTMDIPEDMVSKKAKLDLSEGTQVLTGEEALAYVRARTFEVGGGLGSDLERIERQQQFMSAVTDEILSAGTLGNPVRLQRLVGAVLETVTVSPDLSSVNRIIGMAYSLRNLRSEDVNYYTVPVTAWEQDRNRVIWTDEASPMWEKISVGVQLPSEEGSKEHTG